MMNLLIAYPKENFGCIKKKKKNLRNDISILKEKMETRLKKILI